jgi:hypothetical protein
MMPVQQVSHRSNHQTTTTTAVATTMLTMPTTMIVDVHDDHVDCHRVLDDVRTVTWL